MNLVSILISCFLVVACTTTGSHSVKETPMISTQHINKETTGTKKSKQRQPSQKLLKTMELKARIVPHLENGVPLGFKVFDIKSGSYFEKIGLQNGDVILSPNKGDNKSIDPQQILFLFESIKSKKLQSLQILRGEQEISLDLNDVPIP